MSSGLYSGVSGLALGVGLYRNVSGLWGGASGLIDGFGGADPYAGASLYLNFLTMTAPTFDSRITFSRGTNATLTDSTGRITYAPNNVVTNSVGPSANTGTTVATVSGAAPDGTNAVRLSKTDATTPRYSNWTTLFTVQANTAYVASAYFKYDGFNTTVSVEYNNGTHFGTTWVATFNVTASGITANSPSNCTSGVQAVGNGWFRVWAAFTSGTPSAPTNPTFLTQITGGAGTTVLVTWGQLEQVTYQTTPSTYVATTSAAYYGPRFDYDPVTRAPRGLLIEEQRTNLLTYSAQFDNAAYTNSNITVTANATAAPDGTTTADLLTAASTTSVNLQQSAVVAATSATYSIFAKAGSGATQANAFRLRNTTTATTLLEITVNYDTGAITYVTGSTGATAVRFANGWWRITLSATTGITSGDTIRCDQCFVGPATTGHNAYVWGAQLEAGAFATSYIPTVASTVTRNADVATMTGTNFSSWYNQSEGTFVAEFQTVALRAGGAAGHRVAVANDGSNSNVVYLYTYAAIAGGQVVTGGVTQADINGGGSPANNTTIKSAIAYATNNVAVTVNGATPTTDTSVTIPTVNQLGLGSQQSASQLNGHIRTIAYYNTRLSNSQLQTLTAPSLSTTLSLDFINGAYNVGF